MGILLEFETERLIIKLLTLSQMKLWVNNISILEKELGCKCDGPLEGFFLNIVNNQIKIIENDPENYIYHSLDLKNIKKKKQTGGNWIINNKIRLYITDII